MAKTTKKYPNTSKGRSSVTKKPGAYNLKNNAGKTLYTGETKNLHRRIAEHHRDTSKHFSHFTVTPTSSKTQAKKIESNRLKSGKPPKNKQKA